MRSAFSANLAVALSMLSMVLILLFAGAQISKLVDSIQHSPAASMEHQHVGFSHVVMEPPHADSDGADPSQSPDHAPSHHHHGADPGTTLVALPPYLHVPAFVDAGKPLMDQLELVGLGGSRAERPPRRHLTQA